MKKKLFSFSFFLLFFGSVVFDCSLVRAGAAGTLPVSSGSAVNITAKSAVLMDGSTGTVLYEKDKDKELVPASITKIMTLILIFDAIDSGKLSLDDMVTVSEHAAGMGGSQVFLEVGETQSVETMIKCISIASANDAAVAMAERIAGSEEAFVKMMNERAAKLGMKHTHFQNCNGLDDSIENELSPSGHFSSAGDVALMSRELIMKYPQISKYSTVWMDTITHHTKKGDTEFGLTNTNKLVRYYDGITGLKTGSTNKAKYCLSATASRNGLNLIAVVMAAPDHKVRFSEAQALLDYGFANCSIFREDFKNTKWDAIPIKNGIPSTLSLYPEKSFSHTFIGDFNRDEISQKAVYRDVSAPVKKGEPVGEVIFSYQGQKIGSVPLLAKEEIQQASYGDYFSALMKRFFRLHTLTR